MKKYTVAAFWEDPDGQWVLWDDADRAISALGQASEVIAAQKELIAAERTSRETWKQRAEAAERSLGLATERITLLASRTAALPLLRKAIDDLVLFYEALEKIEPDNLLARLRVLAKIASPAADQVSTPPRRDSRVAIVDEACDVPADVLDAIFGPSEEPRLTTEILRAHLGEKVPGAVAVLAKLWGLAPAEFLATVDRGEVSLVEVALRLLRALAAFAPESDHCQWPGCAEPALCSSGNFGGLLVCAGHFRITNGVAAVDVACELWMAHEIDSGLAAYRSVDPLGPLDSASFMIGWRRALRTLGDRLSIEIPEKEER